MMEQPLIFTERRLLPRLIDVVLTLIAWVGFGYLIYQGVVTALTENPNIGPRPIFSTLNTVSLYLVIALVNACLLIIWAKYNQFRFSGEERRSRAQDLTLEDLAENFQLSSELAQELASGCWMRIHHDDHGTIVALDIRQSPAHHIESIAGSRSTVGGFTAI
ncbi:poly-beta-1,6-N-acetyl-D-glucosamine biosynthesis protein PgaD [Alcanivoracaceae bacterium MT1]|jgi:biofilm PGA synthesis protein PgaD|tara:strand:+ start:1786 stop:2271 length:486 start_codon:yes stop_codon:yes gene_type:complete